MKGSRVSPRYSAGRRGHGVCGHAAALGALAAGARAAGPSKGVADALSKIPTTKTEQAEEAFKALAAGGGGVVRELVGLVGDEFGDPDGVKGKYGLHGLAVHSSRPGAAGERRMVAGALAGELRAGHSPELKAFIVRQLQLCGTSAEAPAIGRLLGDERLCEPAAQALLALGGQEATAVLREALPGAKGKRLVTILQALGRLGDAASAPAAHKAAEAKDRDLRLAGLYALGRMGDAASADTLLKAAGAEDPFERSRATAACLALARTLAARGKGQQAGQLLRSLMASRKAEADVHDRCGALAALADALGEKALGDVTAALDSSDPAYRVPAARTGLKLAASLQAAKRPGAEKLLKKVMAATEEKAVLQQAHVLLAKAEKGESS